MHKKYKLLPPIMPNFISIEMPACKRQDGFKELPKIPITDLTPEEAKEYAKLMFDTFLEHWYKKQSQLLEDQQKALTIKK